MLIGRGARGTAQPRPPPPAVLRRPLGGRRSPGGAVPGAGSVALTPTEVFGRGRWNRLSQVCAYGPVSSSGSFRGTEAAPGPSRCAASGVWPAGPALLPRATARPPRKEKASVGFTYVTFFIYMTGVVSVVLLLCESLRWGWAMCRLYTVSG